MLNRWLLTWIKEIMAKLPAQAENLAEPSGIKKVQVFDFHRRLMRRLILIPGFLAVFAGILVSCSPERNLARAYVRNHTGDGIMLSPSDILYKANPGAYMDKSKFRTGAEQDSVAYYTSNYVQFISDSVFLTLFTNSLIDELTSLGYQVTLDQSADLFLDSKNPAWIVQLSQLQLEEDFTVKYAYGYDDEDHEYYQDYRINSIGLNSWTEVNRVNSEEGTKQLLYLSGYIEDDVNQSVRLDFYRGQFYFSNSRDTISFADIYRMASQSGKKHAELLFDYFMNDYIRRNLPHSSATRKEMHYNHKLNKITAGLPERFDVVH